MNLQPQISRMNTDPPVTIRANPCDHSFLRREESEVVNLRVDDASLLLPRKAAPRRASTLISRVSACLPSSVPVSLISTFPFPGSGHSANRKSAIPNRKSPAPLTSLLVSSPALRTMRTLFALALFCAAALGLAADPAAHIPLAVTANTILDDLVHQVGGDQVRTHCLVRPGDDPHAFEPRPSDVKHLVAADILVINGLNLEPAILKLAQNCGFRGEILVATAGLHPRSGTGEHHDEGDNHADHCHVSDSESARNPPANPHSAIRDPQSADPHAWQSPRNIATYITNIRDALTRANPAAATLYASRATAYLAELAALDLWVREQVATIPPARRKLVTSHDSLGYFADAYGFETVPLAGLSTSAEPDARSIAAIVDLIRHEQVPAVFVELTINPKLVRQIGADAGVHLAEPLYTDTVGTPGSGAETYLDLFRTNVSRIVAALQ